MIRQLGYRDRNAGFITPLAAYLSNDNFLMGNCSMLTQEMLKILFNYNPETGNLIRLSRVSPVAACGDIAGWHSEGYLRIVIEGKKYLNHRLVWLYMTGEWPKDQIDHINHIRDDNRWVNLREATNKENHKNRTINKTNTSGVTGVCWNKRAAMWAAYITTDGKQKHLSYSDDKFEAICTRKSAERKRCFHENHGAIK